MNEGAPNSNEVLLKDYPLLSQAILNRIIDSDEHISVEEGEYEDIPVFVINGNLYPKSAGDATMADNVSNWAGGIDPRVIPYSEMIEASGLKQKLLDRYGEIGFGNLISNYGRPNDLLQKFVSRKKYQ